MGGEQEGFLGQHHTSTCFCFAEEVSMHLFVPILPPFYMLFLECTLFHKDAH